MGKSMFLTVCLVIGMVIGTIGVTYGDELGGYNITWPGTDATAYGFDQARVTAWARQFNQGYYAPNSPRITDYTDRDFLLNLTGTAVDETPDNIKLMPLLYGFDMAVQYDTIQDMNANVGALQTQISALQTQITNLTDLLEDLPGGLVKIDRNKDGN